jgi:hypothetical protein
MAYANWVDKKNRFQRRTKVVVEMRKISTLRDSAYADAQDGAFFFSSHRHFSRFFVSRGSLPRSSLHINNQHDACNVATAKCIIFLLCSDVADAVFTGRFPLGYLCIPLIWRC